MRTFREIAQAARFQAMKPQALQIAAPSNSQHDGGVAEFHRAAFWAAQARKARYMKRNHVPGYHHTPGQLESQARRWEAAVREIALRCEIALQRQADELPAGPCHGPMLGIMLGTVA